MIDCIIKRHTGPSSDEHVIPSAIGGTYTIPWVCRKCNNDFCSALDAVLVDDPLILHARFAYRTGDVDTAGRRVFGEGTMEDGIKVHVKFNEETGVFDPIVLGAPKTVTDNGDGTAQVTWTLTDDSPERILQIVNRELRKRGDPEITLEDLPSRVTTKVVEIEKPVVKHRTVIDLVGMSLAGLKIAYEFAYDTLRDPYLEDEIADSARDIILAGVPAADAPDRTNLETHGTLSMTGIYESFPLRNGYPKSMHVLVLKAHGDDLLVLIRLFDIYEGV
jgi:hypothetical protein